MKKHIAFLLSLLLLLSGCSAPVPVQEDALRFYYCTAETDFDNDAVTIQSEMREAGVSDTTESIIRIYLKGPMGDGLTSPFPAGVQLIALIEEEHTVFVTLSKEFAKLSNLELTMACSCLALTVLDLTDMNYVSIAAENSLLNGQQAIIFDRNTVLLQDAAAEQQ